MSSRPLLFSLRCLICTGLVCLTAPLWTVPGQAQDSAQLESAQRPSTGQEQRTPESRSRISAGQAAAIAQRRLGGKVMNVSTQQAGGAVIYRVRILQESGHMRTVGVNGHTGALMN